jgi:hypothetical protein
MFEQLSKLLKMDGIHIFFVGCSLFEFYAKCGSKKMWQNDYPLFLVQNHIFG